MKSLNERNWFSKLEKGVFTTKVAGCDERPPPAAPAGVQGELQAVELPGLLQATCSPLLLHSAPWPPGLLLHTRRPAQLCIPIRPFIVNGTQGTRIGLKLAMS